MTLLHSELNLIYLDRFKSVLIAIDAKLFYGGVVVEVILLFVDDNRDARFADVEL